MLKIVLSILAILAISKATYVPGTPGIQWTEEQASIIQVIQFIYINSTYIINGIFFSTIQAKIVYLFEEKTNIINKFDILEGGSNAVDADYLFDPTERLSTKDCDTDGQCESAWGKI